jgi:hypothetical protein
MKRTALTKIYYLLLLKMTSVDASGGFQGVDSSKIYYLSLLKMTSVDASGGFQGVDSSKIEGDTKDQIKELELVIVGDFPIKKNNSKKEFAKKKIRRPIKKIKTPIKKVIKSKVDQE